MQRRNYGAYRSTAGIGSKYMGGPAMAARQRKARSAAAAAARSAMVPSGRYVRKYPRMGLMRTGGFLGVEKKFLDVYASAVAIPAPTDCSGGEMQPEGGCTGCLSAPAQGDGASNRDGRAIQMKSIFITGNIQFSATAASATASGAVHTFLALVLDTQTNGSTVVSEQVFTNPNDTAQVNCWPLRNIEYSSRYKVLAHVTLSHELNHVQDAAGTASQVPYGKPWTLAWRGELPIRFTSGTTADVANVENNAVHLIAFATGTGNTPAVNYNSRMRFVG